MTSIQERLQLKRVPIDTWNVREQLCLASAVVRSGDQNWMSVSRALKTVGEPNRPPDWYSQKSCAAQYGALLEHVETPKRKKRSSEGAVETPQESIVKRLTQDRIAEIQKNIADMNHQYEQLKNEISEVRNQATSEDRLREIWSSIEATKRAHERESARRAAWLKEREERRARAARNSRGSLSTEPQSPSAAQAPPSSPLLTSLLKSSPVVTTPQHLSHPSSVVDTMSPSVTAPTLSMLLEKSSPQQDSKRAAIEHIKSQLVQIEQQLKANTPPSPAPLAPGPPAPLATPPALVPPDPPAPPLDIDDIEINAEDVYVFRDVDIHIPSVPHAHDKPIEKEPKKEEDEYVEIEVDSAEPAQVLDVLKEEQIVEDIKEEIPIEFETEACPSPPEPAPSASPSPAGVAPPPSPLDVAPPPSPPASATPRFEFPTTEIKVVHSDEHRVKEETKQPEPTPEETQAEEEVVVTEEQQPPARTVEDEIRDLHAETTVERPAAPAPSPPPPSPPPPPPVFEVFAAHVIETRDIPLPPEPDVSKLPLPPEPEVRTVEEELQPEVKADIPEVELETSTEVPPADEKIEEDMKKDEDAEDSIPLKQMLREESLRTIREDRTTEEAHTETDDDTPMELSREEEKDGKKKKDYSRKKKPDSRTCSGSESAAEASAPESPSASDAEREHRLWKKSVMLVYSRLCAHKYASLFQRPITDEEAPGYSVVVKRPMDLTTIRKNIENGLVRTTAQFQHAVLLMLSNALMYNSSEHSVYSMAKAMQEEATYQLGILLAAQAHASLDEAPPARRKRRGLAEPRDLAKRAH